MGRMGLIGIGQYQVPISYLHFSHINLKNLNSTNIEKVEQKIPLYFMHWCVSNFSISVQYTISLSNYVSFHIHFTHTHTSMYITHPVNLSEVWSQIICN